VNRLAKKTAADLDWRRLLGALAARCNTPMGEAVARDLPLAQERGEVEERLAEVGEARELASAGYPLPLDGFVDVAGHLDRASRHAVLDPEELLGVASTIAAFRRLSGHLSAHGDEAPRLRKRCGARSAEEATRQRDLEELLRSCFEEDGSLSDHASPQLAVLRAKVRSLRERLSRQVQKLLEQYEDVLQDSYFTVRDDRYVLPVRTDAHRRVHGIVHGHSGSGQTLYVEPRELTTMGNELVIAQTEVAREEQRVLGELSEEVRLRIDDLERILQAAEHADLRSAGARLAERLGATQPEISDGEILLRAARHPLLVLDDAKVVANDLTVHPDAVLVVSGPNGGGKTVALKTVGLLLLMLRAGLPVPAAPGSRLPVTRSIWTDMGDDQSLEQSLSTFAAHMQNIAGLLDQSGPGDVALLDELAGGTDPTEGAALAAEIARAVAARGVAVMCTTHYGSLKLLAMSEKDFEGASLGFDKDTLSPTFRLAPGAPGVSGALAAAQRYGLPADVIEAARERMGEDAGRLTSLVEQLEAERARAQAQADAAVDERTELERAKRQLVAEREELRRKGQKQLDKEARDLLAALRGARAQVVRVEEQLKRRKRSVTEKDVKDASKALGKVGAELGPGGKLAPALQEEKPPGRAATQEDLQLGTRVWVPSMRGEGEILEAPKRRKVKVALGRVTMQVEVEGLRVVDGKKATKAPRRPPMHVDAAGDAEVPAMTPDNTLDLRGERVDDGIGEADKFIDRALQRGLQNAFFIHGHGTGALRDGLRRWFDECPYVERWKPAERRQGGEGVTVIWLA